MLAEKSKQQLTCLEEKTEIYITFSITIEKKLKKSIKMKNKSQDSCLTDHNLLIAQHFREAHHQTFLIILLKEFIKLNVNMDIAIKECEACGIEYKYCECFLEYTNLKGELMEYRFLCCNKSDQKDLMKF